MELVGKREAQRMAGKEGDSVITIITVLYHLSFHAYIV
jgi:hypothetical protein